MSAKHALLGLLLHRSAYPYELADRLQGRLGPAWAINSGQLYQTIKRLEDDGLIARVDSDAEARDDRHVYAITEPGIEEFQRWFDGASCNMRLSRRPLLVKITLAGPERLKDAIAQIHEYELSCAAQLRELSMVREAIPIDEPRLRADHVLLRLNLSADIFQTEGELRWARHAHEMVSWLLGREALWPSASGRSSAEEARMDARRKLFSRMASGHLESTSIEQAPSHQEGKAG